MKFKNFENASQSYYRPSMPIDVIREVRKALQKDLVDYLEASGWHPASLHDGVCKIVEENFNKLLPPKGENS